MALILLAILAGPLAAAGLAKLVTAPDRVAWPIRRGPLRTPHGQRVVGAAELAAAVVVTAAPGLLAAAVAVTAYAALTVAALATRGQLCACFGAARLAAVGRLHVAANATGALAGAAAAVVLAVGSAAATGGPAWPLRVTVATLAAALTYAAVLLADRRSPAPAAAPCIATVHAVHVYVADDCPSCRSLKHLLRQVEPARLDTVRTTVVARDAELPGDLRGLGVPCAQGLDAAGRPVCPPVSGIGGVKGLVDRVTIVAAVRSGT